MGSSYVRAKSRAHSQYSLAAPQACSLPLPYATGAQSLQTPFPRLPCPGLRLEPTCERCGLRLAESSTRSLGTVGVREHRYGISAAVSSIFLSVTQVKASSTFLVISEPSGFPNMSFQGFALSAFQRQWT